MAKSKIIKTVTGVCTLAYVALSEPVENLNGKKQYKICVIIDKNDTETVDKIKTAISECYAENINYFTKKNKKAIDIEDVTCLHDGDIEKEGNKIFENSYYFNTKTDYKPKIFDKKCEEIPNPDDIYSGMKGKVAVSFYAYNSMGNIGISSSFVAVQKIADGERIESGVNALEIFGVAE